MKEDATTELKRCRAMLLDAASEIRKYVHVEDPDRICLAVEILKLGEQNVKLKAELLRLVIENGQLKRGARLLDGKALLNEMFDEESRPSMRWLRDQQKNRSIPHVRIGRLIFFNPTAVMDALSARTVKAKT